VLEGLAVALANIDPVIALIKASASPADAKQALIEQTWPPGAVSKMLALAGADTSRPEGLGEQFGLIDGGYRLSAGQAQAILDLRLHRLTGLEQEKILNEYDEILGRIKDLLDILKNPERMRTVIRDELVELKGQYADVRRTEIIVDQQGLDPEDLIVPEEVVVTLSHSGYVKWQPIDVYAAQKRGGMGKSATSMKEEDFVDQLFVANTHDTILCFSSRGKMYWLRVYDLPQASRMARGKPIVNLLPLEESERISAVLPLQDFQQSGYVLMATASGVVKKTSLQEFSRPRTAGIIAIDLVAEDRLVGVAITDGDRDVMLASSGGKMIRFNEREVRPMGRNARGVIGMRIPEGQSIISLIITGNGRVLTATENGYGKCTNISEYRPQGRGGQGIISIQTSKRNGQVVSALLVDEGDEMMLITSGGKLVRTRVDEVSVLGRNTQGVKLIRLRDGERLVGVERVEDVEEGEGDGDVGDVG
jgi:DNA gyrase subunit A